MLDEDTSCKYESRVSRKNVYGEKKGPLCKAEKHRQLVVSKKQLIWKNQFKNGTEKFVAHL